MSVAGVILAGGQARRMGGGQKALLELKGRHLIGHVIARITPQADPLALNVNTPHPAYDALGLPQIADSVSGYPGPLAGILSGLEWAALQEPAPDWLLSAPTDAPLLPDDLAERLIEAADREDAEIAVATSGGRTHPVVALWRVGLAAPLRQALVEDDVRKIDRFTAGRRTVHVEWDTAGGDPFFNINRPEDLAEAETILG
ncbi:MAG: molybdenum cofactor guanylyltransferase MobA [Minwuia sp.]|uniref:molybdenum cofactor guanylyltransferase MobA n=1 Tax=Minwuia sp. TaxID=2493630 RepID=UPI003A8AA2D8